LQESGATIAKAASPILDADGRIRYIVDLFDDDPGKPAIFQDADAKINWHKTFSAKAIDDVKKYHGIEVLWFTAVIGTSFTAYLTDKQVDKLAKDKRVKMMTQDAYIKASALWNDINDNFGYPPQVRPWGLQALGVTYAASSNGAATVYVLDTGVEMHSDLTGLSAANRLSALPGINPTGCYAHGTHVAGIIGASVDNYAGVVGVLPNVRLVSIAIGDKNSTAAVPCPYGSNLSSGSYNYSTSGIHQGLEIVSQQILQGGKVAIVNISFNVANDFSSTALLGQKMKAVATPYSFYVGSYKGALIVQSAGNDGLDACTFAYNAPAVNDGILVVGGLDENGQRAVSLNGQPSYINMPRASDDAGSNTGNCVEVWAPSQRIKSTWSGGSTAYLSGTSMAAPHVAGFAARLLESDPSISTSLALEAAVRARLTTIAGSNLAMPQLVNTSPVAQPTVEVAEGAAHSSSLTPINFSKYVEEVNLRVQAEGASSCSVYLTQSGMYWSYAMPAPSPSATLLTSNLPPGQYAWNVTCTSPLGTTTTVIANGKIKAPLTVNWQARTSSTGGNWQTINNGDIVYWANGPFDQRVTSSGATYCGVQSFGYNGNYARDPEYAFYNVNNQFGPPFSATQLWPLPAGTTASVPTAYTFATFTYGNPQTAAPPLGPFLGYKWKLTCGNADGAKSTVMYGRQSPQ
jgi:Subtilase family